MPDLVLDPNYLRNDIPCVAFYPHIITGMLRMLLTQHFSSPSNLWLLRDNPRSALATMVWRPDNDTGIIIESAGKFSPEVANSKPAVFIKRERFQKQKIAIGDRFIQRNVDGVSGDYSQLWIGVHILNCMYTDFAVTELLAGEVFTELTRLTPIIIHETGLVKFEVVEMGGANRLDENREIFFIPITVQYALTTPFTIAKIEQ
jgi:hypothetical protein